MKRNGAQSAWCAACRRQAARKHIRQFYASLPPDRRHSLGAARRAANVGARSTPYSRSEVFARWHGACVYCGAPAQHLDHVLPLARGGDDIEDNVVPACAPCNLSKGAKLLSEWRPGFEIPTPF